MGCFATGRASLENATWLMVLFTKDFQYLWSMRFIFASLRGNYTPAANQEHYLPSCLLSQTSTSLEQDRVISLLIKNTFEE